MKTIHLSILFSSTIIIAAIAYGITVFPSPQNTTKEPEEVPVQICAIFLS